MLTNSPIVAKKQQAFRMFADRNKRAIVDVIPRGVSAEMVLRTAFMAADAEPALYECGERSLFGAIVKCAQLGLAIGTRGMAVGAGAYLVPFRDTKAGITRATIIVDYRGLMALARRSGQVSVIECGTARKGDQYEREIGRAPRHKRDWSRTAEGGTPPPDVQMVYATARLADGAWQTVELTPAEVELVRARAKAGQDGPWVTDWEAMAWKTAIRRLCKFLPLSTEEQRIVSVDEKAEIGMPEDLADAIPDAEFSPVPATPDDGAKATPTPVAPPLGQAVQVPATAPSPEPAPRQRGRPRRAEAPTDASSSNQQPAMSPTSASPIQQQPTPAAPSPTPVAPAPAPAAVPPDDNAGDFV